MLLALTLLAEQKGVEAEVVDGQVEPALPGHTALPVATGVIIDQLLPIGHPELLPHFQLGLLELPGVLVSLGLHVLVLFCDDALEEDTGNQPAALGAPGHCPGPQAGRPDSCSGHTEQVTSPNSQSSFSLLAQSKDFQSYILVILM